MSEKSLQINISRVDDARAVIVNLQAIKQAYDAHGCSSVEFAIAEEVVTPTAPILAGVIPWTKTYRKTIKAFGDNVQFILPDGQPIRLPIDPNRTPYTTLEAGRPEESKVPKTNRYLRNVANGKSAPLVQVPPSGAT